MTNPPECVYNVKKENVSEDSRMMTPAGKYKKQFFPAPAGNNDWMRQTALAKPPVFCSVDLRDGNQALMTPMSLEEKMQFFRMLCRIGFKEIEVGFPAASETEYEYLRYLIDNNEIPDDVTIQVLTQSREHIIRRTFEALRGCKNAIVHLYNPVSYAQRTQVFRMSREEIKEIALSGARLMQHLQDEEGTNYRFEYSPESFTGTEPDFALEVCAAVLDIWKPTPEHKAIINLPATVELSMPHVYAGQVAYFHQNLPCRDAVTLSLHPHNDRGCAVADAEMGLLAGAERLEGTLFGNGERTGNTDLITVAMNLYSQGIEPGLDFSDLPEITDLYETLTRMHVSERSPYSGRLVFAAFSGSHQDAIAKGMKWREEQGDESWTVPYLPIDPEDVGRAYETDVIRINSQSGGGGIGYLLEQHFGLYLPPKLRMEVGKAVKSVSDRKHMELRPEDVFRIFRDEYVNIDDPVSLKNCSFLKETGGATAVMDLTFRGVRQRITGSGNGRLDAVSNAIREALGISFSDLTYSEHAMTTGSTSAAVSYVGIKSENGSICWGVGIEDDIIQSSVLALISAVNRTFQ